jgi:arylsulfatase A-like enzyme
MTTIYPTLVELCGLPVNTDNDGISVAAQVRDPSCRIDMPALMTYGFNNHAIRTDRWRYIRYADGTEELYDHDHDPHEWTNLALDPAYREIISRHAKWVPTTNAKPFRNLKSTRPQ